MKYYHLTIPGYDQYKFAWAEETDNAKFSDDFPKCPECGRAVGSFYWLPPYDIIIKQPKKIGDFIYCGSLIDLIVSEQFKDNYVKSALTGIEEFMELNIVKMGTKNNSNYPVPRLFGAKIKIVNTQVDYNKMNVKWFSKPKKKACKLCCPGGGGDSGIYQTYDNINIKEKTLTDYDFFITVNFVGNILITERAKDFIENNNFTNVKLTPVDKVKYDMFSHEK